MLNKKTLSKRAAVIFLTVMTALQLVIFLVGGMNKAGYHLDEIFSYGLSNSKTGAFLYDDLDKWVDGSTFRNYITVQNNEGFSYGSVYDNQAKDVHPPFYYFLLHTICSFFPNTFSKWFGLSLNLLIFVFTQAVLYLLSRHLLKSRFNALLVCGLWGFSIGALNTFIFIRMYALLTLFVLLTVLIHLKLLKQDSLTVKNAVPVVLVTIIGGLTHYYFLIYTFFLAMMSCVYFLTRKRRLEMFKYIGTMLFSLACIFLIFPAIVSHLLGGRGQQVASGFLSVGLLSGKFITMAGFIFRELIGIPAAAALLLSAVIGLIVHLTGRARHRRAILSADVRETAGAKSLAAKLKVLFSENIILVGLLIVSCVYVWIIANVSPDMGDYFDRYIFCAYPILCIGLTGLIILIIRGTHARPEVGTALVLAIAILFIAGSHLYPSKYLYIDTDDRRQLNDKVAGADCIYVIPWNFEIHAMCDAYMYSDRVFTAMTTDRSQIRQAVSDLDASKDNLLLIYDWNSGADTTALLDMIEKQTNFQADFLFKGLHGNDHIDVYALQPKAQHGYQAGPG